MEELPYVIFIIVSMLSCASPHLSCASPITFTRRHLSQAPVTGGLPFFPAYGSPSPPPSPPPPTPLPTPPPAPADLTFPANISALVLPSSPKQHTASRTLIIPVISAVLAASTAIILALFLYGRWRGQTGNFKGESKTLASSETNPSEQAPPCPLPRNTTDNKLSVSPSGSRFVKPDSPEISPLPPLPALNFLREEDDDEEDFYSCKEPREQRLNPYSNFSPSPSSTSDFPAMISPPPERQVRNDKRVFSLWNQSIGFPRVSSASTSPERGPIKTPDAYYARSSMYSSVSTTPERFFFRKVLETSSPPPRWNDLSRNVKSLFLSSSPARDVCIDISESAPVHVHPPPRRPPPPTPEPAPSLVPPSQSFMAQKPGKKTLSFSELPQSCWEAKTERAKPLPFRPSSCRKNTWDGIQESVRVLLFYLQRLMISPQMMFFNLHALRDGHYEALGVELLESLSRIALSEEEERKLKRYSDDEEDSVIKLAPSEKFLKELLNVPFVFKRVDALLSVATFGSKIEHLKRSFGVIQAACEELRNTKTLLKLLEAVWERGLSAHDFKLEALLELVGRTTVLHSVVHNIIESEGIKGLQAVGSLSSVFVEVKKAAEMDYGVLRSEVFKIYQGVKKVSEVLLLLNGENGDKGEQEWWTFRESMTRFLETAVEEIKKIETIEGSVISSVKGITEYFHGDSEKEEAQVLRVFVIVSDFLTILDEVCKEMDAGKEGSTLA
ncbi:Formin-like protein 10 [Raphanus sativus]|nr:Formin-like protein 10 [Raphanus sativus]